MTDHTCVRCGAVTPPHDVVSVASPDGGFRLLCSRCFNTEMAHLADVHAFEHPEFTPVRLPDADGVEHEFPVDSADPESTDYVSRGLRA